jgi:hypothetical protein
MNAEEEIISDACYWYQLVPYLLSNPKAMKKLSYSSQFLFKLHIIISNLLLFICTTET